MSESTAAPARIPGKPVLAQSDQDTGIQEQVLLLGIDMGTSRSSIVSMHGGRKTIESYVGWPKDPVSRKFLKTDIVLRQGPPWTTAWRWTCIARSSTASSRAPTATARPDDPKRNLEAAKMLVKHLVDLVNPRPR